MKKHILIPAALLIFLGAVAYFTYPGQPYSGVGFTQYYITIGVSTVVIIASAIFIRKKEKNAQKYKDLNKKK